MKSEISNVKLSEAVRKVLDHYELEDADFERLDPIVDWESMAKSIENPTKTAVCHTLNAKGEVVMRRFEPSLGKPEEPAIVYVEVHVNNAEEELKQKPLVFIEWWD